MYLALSTAPHTVPTGEVTRDRQTGEEMRWHRVKGWRELGLIEATNVEAALAEAKRRFGGSPVIVSLGKQSIH